MIDLHCHILPGIDDGAESLEIALGMARASAAEGITIIAATPHGPGSYISVGYSPSRIHQLLGELRQALQREAIAVEIVAGTELNVAPDLPEQLQAGKLLAYGASHTVLLECPYNGLPPMLDQAVFQLQVAGYRIVLAHPERCRDVQRNPAILAPLISRGVLMQLTAEALTGGQGSHIQSLAEQLLQSRLIHLIASDSHNLSRRPPGLSAARDAAAALLGEQEAQALVQGTPAAILADTPISLPEPQLASRPRRWW